MQDAMQPAISARHSACNTQRLEHVPVSRNPPLPQPSQDSSPLPAQDWDPALGSGWHLLPCCMTGPATGHNLGSNVGMLSLPMSEH